MKYLVGVGIADAAENAWIGQCAFESTVLHAQGFAEGVEIDGEDVNAAGIDRVHRVFVTEDI